MNIKDITALIASHTADPDSDGYDREAVEWITDGVARLIVNVLNERGLELRRRDSDLTNAFAEIAVEFMIAQHQHTCVMRGLAMMRETAAATPQQSSHGNARDRLAAE